jgi:hypothetical protein
MGELSISSPARSAPQAAIYDEIAFLVSSGSADAVCWL